MSNTFITFGGEQENSEGKAHIFFGGDSMDSTADVNLTGESAGDRFGYSVSCAGDVDGDGKTDVIVGAPYWDNGATTDCGQVLVFKGGSSMDTIADYVHNGTQANEHFGWSVSLALIMDDGSNSMVVVGSPHHDGSTDTGKTEILYIPEYSTIVMPIFSIIILFIIQKRRKKCVKNSTGLLSTHRFVKKA
ncbi:MAG: FG-GAP repeat protein [Thermoplasmata archaeon]|nr:MAG: FG-GAP repeat protein [Thermoplasmata archaeon]